MAVKLSMLVFRVVKPYGLVFSPEDGGNMVS
jgi:hypothetical protein